MYINMTTGAAEQGSGRQEGSATMADASLDWVKIACFAWLEEGTGADAGELLERLMADENCPAFGPAHHALVGAALLACSWRAVGKGELGDALDELFDRASCVPGAACAKWGVCGAAASCGMAFAILSGNAPLKKEGWGEGQRMVAQILAAIADAGAPRCCKRDSRIAVRVASSWFNDQLHTRLVESEPVRGCAVCKQNSACLGSGCPFFS